MFPKARLDSKKFIKNDINDIIITNGKYIPKYEVKRDLISERDLIELFKNYKVGLKIEMNEHEIIDEITNAEPQWFNPNLNYKDLLLFIHWYERKYKVNKININILINLYDFSGLIPTRDNKNKISNLFDKKEFIEIVKSNIEDIFKSNSQEHFTIIHDNYLKCFPNIEIFDFVDLFKDKFLNYLLELYPNISGISTKKIHYIRYSFESLNELVNSNKIESGISYLNKFHLPSFNPIDAKTANPISNIENIMRDSKGLPRIGEGWISETTLYYEIKNYFPALNVIHHGKPKWLGRQHFDIWIPEICCAIEYQGLQHFKPIEYFGGEESYIKNIKRDIEKREKAKNNNVTLIEVLPDYDINLIIESIKKLL